MAPVNVLASDSRASPKLRATNRLQTDNGLAQFKNPTHSARILQKYNILNSKYYNSQIQKMKSESPSVRLNLLLGQSCRFEASVFKVQAFRLIGCGCRHEEKATGYVFSFFRLVVRLPALICSV